MAGPVARLLEEFLQQHTAQLATLNQSVFIRVVLGGPPLGALRELFTLLTQGGDSAWEPLQGTSLPIFLVTREPITSQGQSRECNWDYALAVRNSYPNFVLLVDPSVWDDRTYSIINATDAIGSPLPPVKRSVASLRKWSPLYANLADMAARKVGKPPAHVESAIREALLDLPSLDPAQQHALPWEVLERVAALADTGLATTNNDLAAECGLLPSSNDGFDFARSRKTQKQLAEFLEDGGIEKGVQELKATSKGSVLGLPLTSLEEHLRRSAGSASAFARAPTYYHYVSGQPRPSWWQALTVEVIEEMLTEAGGPPAPERLSIECVDPLNPVRSPGEPYIVLDQPSFEARHPSGTFQARRFLRRRERQSPQELASAEACESPWTYRDVSPPTHTSPLTYTIEDNGAIPASAQVVVLSTYAPGAFITCPGPTTKKISKPRRARASSPWQQDLLLRSGGTKVLKILCGSPVSRIRVTEPFPSDIPVANGSADLRIDIDEDTDITVEAVGSDGQTLFSFVLSVAIEQDEQETAPSFFDALVQAHQQIRNTPPIPMAKDSWLRRIEEELLKSSSSWNPILASPGWPDSAPRLDGLRLLGVLRPQVDPRPAISPPASYLDAREQVIRWLGSKMVPLPEIDLVHDDVKTLVTEYLRSYREWTEKAPAEACWADTIVVLEREPGQYGDRAFAAHEPVAVLLSPLHPIRLGWQAAAQRVLSEALESPCPLAGFLDPHRCPDLVTLALARSGGEPRWKSYVAISCQQAGWGLYWDAGRLRDLQTHESITELSRAGLVPRGIQSGFTASQAKRTLEEITRVVPTRAELRVGIVSASQGSTSCTDGLITWCREQFGGENQDFKGPRSLEVYDSRQTTSQPSREEISSLADDTEHRVRWFGSSGSTPSKDLVIIDHLGMASPVNEVHPWRSPAAEGNLVRSRIRMDRNNAQWVVESRAAVVVESEDSLLDELSQAIGAVENTAAARAACSHVAFTPNREVLGTELQGTRFLAVSSAEIDPACFARGTPQSGGFLWDYELPQALGPGEQRGGFYLLAKPPDAIKRAVLTAIRLVSQAQINVDPLLVETSRRGIPILKRLAAGGSMARGELGMLLAVRLLQDAFRGTGTRVRLPVFEAGVVHMVLPVDPYVAPLERLRQGLRKADPSLTEANRPDLLLACIQTGQDDRTRIHLVPLEVKFREGVMTAQDKGTSLAQASGLGETLQHLLGATPLNHLWKMCGHGFLGEILDHGFRVYGDPSVNGKTPEEWVAIHQACIADVIAGRATVSVAQEGRLIVFDEFPYSHAEDIDGDGFEETLVVSREDSRALLEEGVQLSEVVDKVATLLDICATASETGSTLQAPVSTQQTTPAVEPIQVEPQVAPTPPVIAAQTTAATVPPEVREHVSRAFSGFIGNGAAVNTVRRAILKALLTTPPQMPASYLFTGNPSTGKTELARRVARCLGLPFVSLDGRGLGSRDRLFELIDGALRDSGQQATRVGVRYQKPALEYPPLVVFIDEVHLVPRAVQESLLTALEPKDRTVLLSDRVARLPRTTFLFATTRPSDVDMAFRTRCTEIPLQDYSEEEVATIVGLEHPSWPETLRRKIARYGRYVPRVALELGKELANEALVSEHPERGLEEHLEEVRKTRLIDENGLGLTDIEYLELLERESRPVGERNILTMLTNIDKDRFLEEVEPLLVARMRLVKRTERGREITPEGRKYLIERRRRGTQ